jgi:hypothetical protein
MMINADLRASVTDRFGRVADTPGQERKLPVGPESSKRLGYNASEVDSLPASLTDGCRRLGPCLESFPWGWEGIPQTGERDPS